MSAVDPTESRRNQGQKYIIERETIEALRRVVSDGFWMDFGVKEQSLVVLNMFYIVLRSYILTIIDFILFNPSNHHLEVVGPQTLASCSSAQIGQEECLTMLRVLDLKYDKVLALQMGPRVLHLHM